MNKIIIIILALSVAACSPLKKVATQEVRDSVSIDRSEIRKFISETLKSEAVIRQTDIEFYLPDPVEVVYPSSVPEATPKSTIQPLPIKRIIHTEITTETEKNVTRTTTSPPSQSGQAFLPTS